VEHSYLTSLGSVYHSGLSIGQFEGVGGTVVLITKDLCLGGERLAARSSKHNVPTAIFTQTCHVKCNIQVIFLLLDSP
jgi:hypothetical protein